MYSKKICLFLCIRKERCKKSKKKKKISFVKLIVFILLNKKINYKDIDFIKIMILRNEKIFSIFVLEMIQM